MAVMVVLFVSYTLWLITLLHELVEAVPQSAKAVKGVICSCTAQLEPVQAAGCPGSTGA